MAIVKISLNDEEYTEIAAKAKEEKMTVQNYIRFKTLGKKVSPFDPEEAYSLALAKIEKNGTFTLPDLYENWEEMMKLNPNMAGVYGRLFGNYAESRTEIVAVDDTGRRTVYKRVL